MEENVLRFQVIMNDLVGKFMEIANSTGDLPDDEFCLSLWYFFMLLEVVAEIWTLAILQHCAEGIRIDFDSII